MIITTYISEKDPRGFLKIVNQIQDPVILVQALIRNKHHTLTIRYHLVPPSSSDIRFAFDVDVPLMGPHVPQEIQNLGLVWVDDKVKHPIKQMAEAFGGGMVMLGGAPPDAAISYLEESSVDDLRSHVAAIHLSYEAAATSVLIPKGMPIEHCMYGFVETASGGD